MKQIRLTGLDGGRVVGNGTVAELVTNAGDEQAVLSLPADKLGEVFTVLHSLALQSAQQTGRAFDKPLDAQRSGLTGFACKGFETGTALDASLAFIRFRSEAFASTWMMSLEQAQSLYDALGTTLARAKTQPGSVRH